MSVTALTYLTSWEGSLPEMALLVWLFGVMMQYLEFSSVQNVLTSFV